MVFSSLVFVCIFLPAIWILHTVIPNRKVKNGLLLVGSLFFYAYGEPIYVLLLIFSALVNYGIGLFFLKKKSRFILFLAVIFNIGVLCVFKYTGFLLETWNSLTRMNVTVPQIIMPIGISFFTFQALSYVIDIYRGKVAAQKNFFKVLLYIVLFPQLIAGPIVRYEDIAEAIDHREVSLSDSAAGLRRFIVGLAKKVLIANTMGYVADEVFGLTGTTPGALALWIGAIAYLMQIYYDFSGYSDMAIGIGRMFGFRFLENFKHPYCATTLQDFWHRWNISLSNWFRDYVYIPMGGNRKGKFRTALNRLIVFFLTGLWHGANWTFVIWGMFHGMLLLLEEVMPMKKMPRFLGHIYTLFFVTLSFVFFRADSISSAWTYIVGMFSSPISNSFSHLSFLTPFFIVMALAAILCCGPVQFICEKIAQKELKSGKEVAEKVIDTVGYVLAFLLLAWCIIRLAGSEYNPFIYFRF